MKERFRVYGFGFRVLHSELLLAGLRHPALPIDRATVTRNQKLERKPRTRNTEPFYLLWKP
jgi:hypothetical protein